MYVTQEPTCSEVQYACKYLRSKEEVSDLVVEREPLNMQSQKVVEQPQLENQRGDRVEGSTHAETSRRGKFRSKWVEGVHVAIPPGVRWGDVQN